MLAIIWVNTNIYKYDYQTFFIKKVVRSGGLEPPRVLPHSDLNAERLETYFQ